ncbi:unnamed protein product [Urochloa humidicola]
MASTTGEEHPVPTMASAHEAVAALIVEEHAISSVAPTSRNQASPASMHPPLLAAACKGALKELSYLLNREETQAQPNMIPSPDFLDELVAYSSAADIEEAGVSPEASPASLLEAVTMQGDTALHVVAT